MYTRIDRKVFPIVTLDLKIDRETALQEARSLAKEHNWGPEDYREAAPTIIRPLLFKLGTVSQNTVMQAFHSWFYYV